MTERTPEQIESDTRKQLLVDFFYTVVEKILVPHLDAIDKRREHTTHVINQLNQVADDFIAQNSAAPINATTPTPEPILEAE